MKQTLRPIALFGLTVLLAAGGVVAAEPVTSFDDFKALQAYSSVSTNCVAIREQLESTLMALGNDRKALASLQTKLLALLPAPETTHDARDLILRAVQRMGFCNDVWAVAALLTDAKLSHMARFALEGIKDSRVDDAFLAALPKAQGDAKAGLVISLGLRRCGKAVPVLLPLKDLNDAKLAGAALTALGRIGTPECAKALQVPASPALEFQRQSALAACMNLLRGSEAVRVATTVFEDTKAPVPLRAAAIRVLMRSDKGKASAWFAKAMSDSALRVRETAIRVAAKELNEGEALIAALPKAAPEDQVRLLGELAELRERRAGPAAAALLKSPDVTVQQAVARALADVGGPDQVAALAELLAVDDLREAAMVGLSNMRAEGAGQKIAELTAAAEPQQRSRLVAVIAARAGKDALPELAKYINDSNDAVRKDTWRAIREVARPADVEACLGLLAKAQEPDRSAAEQVLVSAMRLMTPEERGPALAAAWNRSDAAVRPSLARIMAYFADAPCATPLIAALDDKTPAVQEAAVRALSGWPDAMPMEALCAKAFSLPTESLRSQAMRGAVRMIAMSPGLDAKARLLDLFRKSPDASGRAAVAAALGERLGLEAFGVLESLFDDAKVGASARKAYIALYDKVKNMTAGELDPKAWKANASHGANIVKLAFDGNKKTRWTTGGEQKPGQWFALDLGRVAAVAAIELDYEASGSDGPKGYKVFSSMDGVAWTGPVAEGEAPPKRVVIKLSGTPVGRWVKIEQTGTKPGLYWSIHELRVRSGTDPAKIEAVARKVEQLRAKK